MKCGAAQPFLQLRVASQLLCGHWRAFRRKPPASGSNTGSESSDPVITNERHVAGLTASQALQTLSAAGFSDVHCAHSHVPSPIPTIPAIYSCRARGCGLTHSFMKHMVLVVLVNIRSDSVACRRLKMVFDSRTAYDNHKSVLFGQADANGVSMRAHYDVDCGAYSTTALAPCAVARYCLLVA